MQPQQVLEKLPALTDRISMLTHAVLPVFVRLCLLTLLAKPLLSLQMLVDRLVCAPSMLKQPRCLLTPFSAWHDTACSCHDATCQLH